MQGDYNPYAAPAVGAHDTAGAIAVGGPQPWTVEEALKIAWTRFKTKWQVPVLAFVVAEVLGQVAGQMPKVLNSTGAVEAMSGAGILVALAFLVLNVLIATFLSVGLTRIWLQVARGEEAVFGTLFSGGDRFMAMLGATILVGMAGLVGFLFFVVPGVILLLGLCLTQFYVVDANMSAMQAMSASWNATKGHRVDLLILGLAAFGLALLGLLMLIVGIFATLPLASIALAVAYTRISGIRPAPAVTSAAR